MLNRVVLGLLLGNLLLSAPAFSNGDIAWPDGTKIAVSLSYDDALNSQLDNAVAALNKYDFKASFYLTLASATILERLPEWRALAASGHELGNHTIYHPCSASMPGRDWVTPYHDMDHRTVAQMAQEIRTANAFLHSIDGNTERTFTPPCGDLLASGENYLPAVSAYFVGIKGNEGSVIGSTTLVPSGLSGEELIDSLKSKAQNGSIANIIFHGIGGDHLAVSKQAHDELLQYLADNREIYWVDTYLAIMQYAIRQKDR